MFAVKGMSEDARDIKIDRHLTALPQKEYDETNAFQEIFVDDRDNKTVTINSVLPLGAIRY